MLHGAALRLVQGLVLLERRLEVEAQLAHRAEEVAALVALERREVLVGGRARAAEERACKCVEGITRCNLKIQSNEKYSSSTKWETGGVWEEYNHASGARFLYRSQYEPQKRVFVSLSAI